MFPKGIWPTIVYAIEYCIINMSKASQVVSSFKNKEVIAFDSKNRTSMRLTLMNMFC
jgi:hypothetical protein